VAAGDGLRRRFARGSVPPPDLVEDWLATAIRARFPKLALALGGDRFDAMLASFVGRNEDASHSLASVSSRLPLYLADMYPLWCAELAAIDQAHVSVLQMPSVRTLQRAHLTIDTPLRLIPAHALVLLMTSADELWTVLEYMTNTGCRIGPAKPRMLERSRTVAVWRTGDICTRTVGSHEADALREARNGTSLRALSQLFRDYTQALTFVLRWIDDGMIAA
jgi:hypothetical protein